MKDEGKTREQFASELSQLLDRIAELESLLEDRKLKEKEIWESEQNYRMIAERAADFIWSMDLKNNFTFISPSVQNFLGYSPEEMKSLSLENILTSDSYRLAKKLLKNNLEKDKSRKGKSDFTWAFELEYCDKEGYAIWCEIVNKFLRDPKGSPIGIIGFTKNITERKQMEEALKESERKFKSLFHNAQVGLYRSRISDGKLIECNDLFARLMGFDDREECIGKFVASEHYVNPEVREQMLENIKKWQEVNNFEAEIIGKDGTPFWVSFSSRIFPGRNCIEGAMIDITNRRQAEEAIKKSEIKFRDLYEKAPMAYFSFSIDSKINDCNKLAQDMSGYDRADLIGMDIIELFSVGQDGRRKGKGIIKGFLKGDMIQNERVQLLRKDNSLIWGGMTINAVRDQGGNILMGRCIIINITDHVALEGQLQQAKKLEAVGTLSGGLANEFNNFLMGIQGNVSLMLLDIDAGHPYYEKLKNIEQYVQRGSNLAGQILGAAGGDQYSLEPVDLNKIVNSASRIFAGTGEHASIHNQLQEKIWLVTADPAQIEKVLLDIYVSAWKGKSGELDIHLQTQNVILKERHCKPFGGTPGRYVKITLADRKSGIQKGIEAKLSEPFFMSEDIGQAEGLSLASAYRIVKNCRGFINAYNEQGSSTVFNIFIPALEKEDGGKEKLSEEVHGGSETILLVDDEEMIIEVADQLLKRMGYTVLVAGSGNEALEIFGDEGNKIDMVILDMIMPDMGGEMVFDRLSEMDPEVKVLLSSGYVSEEQLEKLMERGCKGLLKKPFRVKEMSLKIREVLDRN